ncbi:MAG: (Fe-S)-binding protein [Candidatus Aminicenantales bacterium]
MLRRFAPGCALMIYKPHLAEKLGRFIRPSLSADPPWLTCCRKDPQFSEDTELVNVCPGCDKRFRLDYRRTTTISIWEILARGDGFPFPDYGGRRMSIIDACPTRDQPRIHEAVRTLLSRMNIILVEPKATRTKSVCCGDSYWGEIPTDEVKDRMKKRATQLPAAEVVVYCVSCVTAAAIGGKKPRYLVDLLFGEETVPPFLDLDAWHAVLQDYIDAH